MNGDFKAFIGDSSQTSLLPLAERLSKINPGENPYVTGSALPGNSPVFFGRNAIIHSIVSNLKKSDKPSCISIAGERRIGKSSLINQVRQALLTETGLVQIFGDAQNWGSIDISSFFHSLHQALESVLPKKNKKEEIHNYPEFRNYIESYAEQYRFVLIIDEFEKMAHNPNFNEDFFLNLRSLGNHFSYRFGYLISTRSSLRTVCEQYDATDSSSFWNIFGEQHIIGLLSDQEAMSLCREPIQRSLAAKETHVNTDRIKKRTGCHPALIQLVMNRFLLANQGQYKMDWADVENEIRPHLDDLWKRRHLDEKKLLVALAKYKRFSNSVKNQTIIRDLEKRGLVTKRHSSFSEYFSRLISKGWYEEIGA